MIALVLLLAAAADAHSEAPLDLVHMPLTSQTIEQVVRSHLPALRQCYEMALDTQEGAEGTVTLSWMIDKNGAVSQLKTRSSTAKSPKVGACFKDAVKLWAFPRPKDGRPQPVEYPFRLKLVK